MSTVRIALANLRYPGSPEESVQLAEQAIADASRQHADPPSIFGDPASSFHEKAMLCRAAENTRYFAAVNYASRGSPTTSAIVRPDGTLLSYQPYGVAGLLVADLDLSAATGLFAKRYRPAPDA